MIFTTYRFSVSIHAPVMDAKSTGIRFAYCTSGFNPRARDGREYRCTLLRVADKGFNPRARDGREYRRFALMLSIHRFNPRARDGREQRLP